MSSTYEVVEVGTGIEHELPGDAATRDARTLARVVTPSRLKVVEVGTGIEHELPGDAATRDARTLAYFSYPSGAVLPLVLRSGDAMFYVAGERYPALVGKLVRRST